MCDLTDLPLTFLCVCVLQDILVQVLQILLKSKLLVSQTNVFQSQCLIC